MGSCFTAVFEVLAITVRWFTTISVIIVIPTERMYLHVPFKYKNMPKSVWLSIFTTCLASEDSLVFFSARIKPFYPLLFFEANKKRI